MSNFINNNLDPSLREDYDVVRSKVYNWALRLRLETKQHQAGPLQGVDPPPESFGPFFGPGPDYQLGKSYWPTSNSDQHWGTWGGTQYEPVDALGKGKGQFKGPGKGGGKSKGKGCFICGGPHFARNCPKGKGKGPNSGKNGSKGRKGASKGKKGVYGVDQPGGWGQDGWSQGPGWEVPTEGQPNLDLVSNFQGYCYLCGAWGHSQRYCPTGKGGGVVSRLTAKTYDESIVEAAKANQVGVDAPQVVVEFLNAQPFALVIMLIFFVLSFIFVATSLDSAAFTLAAAASQELPPDGQPPRWHRLVWAFVLAGTALSLMYLGGLKILQAASVVVGLPVVAIMSVMIWSLMKHLYRDNTP